MRGLPAIWWLEDSLSTSMKPMFEREKTRRCSAKTAKFCGGYAQFIRGACLHVHHAETPVLVQLPAQAASETDRHPSEADPPAEERTNGGIPEVRELVAVLEKELPLFGEEQLVAAEIGHLLVDVDLGEIGIHGQIQVEGRTEGHLPVHSDVHAGCDVGVFAS